MQFMRQNLSSEIIGAKFQEQNLNLADNKETSEEEMVHEILHNLIGFNTQNLEPLLLYFISLS